MLLDIWTNNKSDASMRIHMVPAILSIVLDHEDQSVILVAAASDLLNDKPTA